MAAKKPAPKKPVRKKAAKKVTRKRAVKKKVFKDLAVRTLDLRCWGGSFLATKRVPARVLNSRWRPPAGAGHFDRFFFSNCTGDHTVYSMMGVVRNAEPGDPVFITVYSDQHILPMTNGSALSGEPTVKTISVDLNVLVEYQGVMGQYSFPCDIDPAAGEFIIAVMAGLTEMCDGSNFEVHPYAIAIGSEGGQYPTPPSMIMYQPF